MDVFGLVFGRVEEAVEVVGRGALVGVGCNVFKCWSLIYGRPLTLALSHGGERGQSFGCRSIAASLYWVRAGDNWLFFSHTKYSVADVARPSVVRAVTGR